MQEIKGKTMKKFLSKLLIDLIICSIFATSFVVSACAQSVNDNVFFTFSMKTSLNLFQMKQTSLLYKFIMK